MDLPGLSVRRPILVIVFNLLICVAGLGALLGVEVRELPDVDRPIVTVRATFEGAAPEIVDTEVTRVIEGAAARVPGIRSISAASEESYSRVIVEFDPSVDLADAANDLREAVSRIERELPDDVEDLVIVKANDNADPIVQFAVSSDRHTREQLTDIAEDDLVPAMSAVPGVADVRIFGDRERVLRIVIDPLRLASYGLSIDAVAEVMRNARFNVPAGNFDSDDQNLVVRADASVVRADEVEELVIRGTTRIGDVADAFFGPADVESYVRFNGREVIGLSVVRQAQSNTIAIAEGLDEVVEQLRRSLPGIEIVKTSDDAVFIRGALREVVISLVLSVAIVVIVIFAAMRSLRATVVPLVAIPVALIGTLAVIWLLGFSINILTLLALVLATGMVVDDAIVVLENIERRHAQGIGPRAAAVIGTRQVFFAVIATTVTLASVFIPISFLPGSAGRLFVEFGVVLAAAVLISSFVALTLCPMLASRLLRSNGGAPPEAAAPGTGGIWSRLYAGLLDRSLRAPIVAVAVSLLVVAVAAQLFQSVDEELLPPEDRGVIRIYLRGPDGVGLQFMDRQVEKVEEILRPYVQSGEVEGLFAVIGAWDINAARVVAPLAPWAERSRTQMEIASELRGPLSRIPGAEVTASNPNSLGVRGGAGELEFALTGTSYDRIAAAADRMLAAIRERAPQLDGANMEYATTQPQLSVVVDRDRGADLGIDIDGIATALRAMVNGYEVADLNVDDEAIPIILSSSLGVINDPEDLRKLHVATASGRVVPLSSVVTLEETGISPELDREGQQRAIEIEAGFVPGYTLRDGMRDIEAIAADVLPPDVRLVFLDEAATLEETSYGVAVTFGVAVLVVLLVLAAQFESFTSAAVVMVTVPFGIAAAILALWLTGTSLNIYSQIGLIMLVGLMAKNGILIVEFADQLRDQGHNAFKAAHNAALIRLRPVMMTMISTVLGALPLILGAGPGSEARASIGWVVFGGLGFATLFTLVLTPVGYVLLAPLSPPRANEGRRLQSEMLSAQRLEMLDAGGASRE